MRRSDRYLSNRRRSYDHSSCQALKIYEPPSRKLMALQNVEEDSARTTDGAGRSTGER